MLQLTSFVYACINKLVPAVFDNYVNCISNTHYHSTRQAARSDLFVERKNTTQYGIKSVRYAGTNHGIQYLLKLEGLPNFRFYTPLGPIF